MRKRSSLPSVLLGCFVPLLLAPSAVSQANVLGTLRPAHPRLFTLNSDLPSIKANVQQDPIAKHNYQEVRATAEAMLSQPVKTYNIKGGSLLAVAHVIENRVLTLAGLYRVTGDMRFAIRAKQEMLAAAEFPDWNPKHFLEAAEITAALGIGYDWLYDQLTPAERTVLRTAIVKKGIQPWLDNIRGPANLARMGNNWVQVCTGGITVGALAVADEEPALAKEVIDDSRPIMKDIMSLFAPDGGFEEGPTYWDYAVSYNVFYLAALDSALGTDFGLSDAKGFSDTGDYRIQSLGPLWRAANFSDAHEGVPRAFEMYWLASRFQKPQYAIQEERFSLALDKESDARKHWENERFAIFSLFWFKPLPARVEVQASQAQKFERINQAFLRSSWNAATPWYVAFKGGANKAHHAHLDLGTFIMDGLGARWAMDLGGEDYGVPGYFDFKAQRWTYYRTRTESHNTLVVDGENQDLDGTADITTVKQSAGRELAVMNLDAAYKSRLKSWKRGTLVLGATRVLVQDEVTPVTNAKIAWHLHTAAKIKISGSGDEATLSQDGALLNIRILAPSAAHFEVKPVDPPPPQTKAPGVSDLVVAMDDVKTATTIAILFSDPKDTSVPPIVSPLSSWDQPQK